MRVATEFHGRFIMALIGEKSVLSSLTIRGALLALLPLVLRLFGIDLGDDAAGVISNFVEAGITLVGASLVIYGRIRATQKVVVESPI
jgi:hypothetical protein